MKNEAGGTLAKCGVREVVLGMCCFCCPVFIQSFSCGNSTPNMLSENHPFLTLKARNLSEVNSPLGPEVEHLTKV